jgi:NADH-quinone oxidoreductase subunit H
LPESESELVAGYTMDYSAIGFAMFFLGEYSNMLIMSSILVILFLGGWSFPNLFYGIKLIPNLFLFNYILLNSHIIEFATFINFYKNYFNVFF